MTSLDPFVTTFFQDDVTLNTIHINDGDTITRTLFQWRLETAIVDNSGGGGLRPWPAFVALWFTPDPNGDPVGGPAEPGGAQLWREAVHWIAQPWTDGSLFGTKWYASSAGARSGQGQRKIFDKTTDVLTMGWEQPASETNIDNTQYVAAEVWGWVQVDYLVLGA